jgi:hypothetical protein
MEGSSTVGLLSCISRIDNVEKREKVLIALSLFSRVRVVLVEGALVAVEERSLLVSGQRGIHNRSLSSHLQFCLHSGSGLKVDNTERPNNTGSCNNTTVHDPAP